MYIFINGFLGAAFTLVGVGLAISVVLAVAGAYPGITLFSDYFPYFLLLGFSEAWLSGMVITLFVVYRPNWALTFDDSRYLAGNKRYNFLTFVIKDRWLRWIASSA